MTVDVTNSMRGLPFLAQITCDFARGRDIRSVVLIVALASIVYSVLYVGPGTTPTYGTNSTYVEGYHLILINYNGRINYKK
jgi:hypothetical protein